MATGAFGLPHLALLRDARGEVPPVWGNRAVLATITLALSLSANACAPLPAPSWPAASGEPTYVVSISIDTWHAMIALPLPLPSRALDRDEPGAEATAPSARFEEWGYAERAWYLEGRQGLWGILRALLVPSRGVVEVARTDRIWAERTPDPPSEVFRVELGELGLVRLRRHLQGTIASPEPVAIVGESWFYAARASYHLLHQCHQYAARALRAAGLPLSPALAVTPGTLAGQLRDAARRGEEPRVQRASDRPATAPE